MEAIQLVFGTDTRGVEIPRIRENFETNVPGLFIVGELGGMGLIRNAFAQGKAVRREHSGGSGSPRLAMTWIWSLSGCGPAGLSAALTAKAMGLRMAVLEREDIGGTVRHYPRKKLVMTEPVTIPGYGKVGSREIIKEDLIRIWEDAVERSGLQVETGVSVTDVQPLPEGGFVVLTNGSEYRTERVILAIGRRGVPRKLGIPGEDLPNVAYALREPEAYRGDRILVVGGGDSAVEAGLTLAEQPGNEVRLAYRGTSFSRAKPSNRSRVDRAVASGAISVLWSTEVRRESEGRGSSSGLRRRTGSSERPPLRLRRWGAPHPLPRTVWGGNRHEIRREIGPLPGFPTSRREHDHLRCSPGGHASTLTSRKSTGDCSRGWPCRQAGDEAVINPGKAAIIYHPGSGRGRSTALLAPLREHLGLIRLAG